MRIKRSNGVATKASISSANKEGLKIRLRGRLFARNVRFTDEISPSLRVLRESTIPHQLRMLIKIERINVWRHDATRYGRRRRFFNCHEKWTKCIATMYGRRLFNFREIWTTSEAMIFDLRWQGFAEIFSKRQWEKIALRRDCSGYDYELNARVCLLASEWARALKWIEKTSQSRNSKQQFRAFFSWEKSLKNSKI